MRTEAGEGGWSEVGNRAQWGLLVGPGRAGAGGGKLGLGGWGLCIGELKCTQVHFSVVVSIYIYIGNNVLSPMVAITPYRVATPSDPNRLISILRYAGHVNF
jgi:hypothetical protein